MAKSNTAVLANNLFMVQKRLPIGKKPLFSFFLWIALIFYNHRKNVPIGVLLINISVAHYRENLTVEVFSKILV